MLTIPSYRHCANKIRTLVPLWSWIVLLDRVRLEWIYLVMLFDICSITLSIRLKPLSIGRWWSMLENWYRSIRGSSGWDMPCGVASPCRGWTTDECPILNASPATPPPATPPPTPPSPPVDCWIFGSKLESWRSGDMASLDALAIANHVTDDALVEDMRIHGTSTAQTEG